MRITPNLRKLGVGESIHFPLRKQSTINTTIQRLKSEGLEFERETIGNQYKVTRKL